MSNVWLESAKINAVPYRLFIAENGKVVAAIVYSDDGSFYFVFSGAVKHLVDEMVLGLPFVSKHKTRHVVFRCCGRNGKIIRKKGYAVDPRFMDLFTEAVRRIISASTDLRVKIRSLKAPEEVSKVVQNLDEEEKAIYEVAPVDDGSLEKLEKLVKELEKQGGGEA